MNLVRQTTSGARSLIASVGTRVTHVTTGWWVVLAMVVIYVVTVSRILIDVHLGLGTSSYDIGLYDQGTWLLSRFEAPFVTLMGRNLLGDHASLVMFLVVPFYWIVPGSETLLVLQTVAIGAGAFPLFAYARRALESDVLAVMIAACWLLNPAVNGTAYENFHPDGFIGFFLPLALYAALTERWRLYFVAFVLCLTVKEDVALVMVPLGVFVALTKHRKWGVISAVASVVATVLGMFVLMRSLIGVPTRNTWRIPFGGPSGFVKEVFTNPINVWRHLTSEDRPLYVWKMVAPFAGVFLLVPDLAVISAFVILANIVSTFWYQFHIEYHYSLIAVPGLIFGTVYALQRVLMKYRQALVAIVLMTTITTAYFWSPLPFAQTPFPHWPASHPVAVAARDIIDVVPEDASIAVFHSLAPHLAHRKEIYQFPTPFRTVLYGVDLSLENTRLPQADTVQYVVLPVNKDEQMAQDWKNEQSRFRLLEANAYWEVFVRR
jgi:uncharacterized membrane protein